MSHREFSTIPLCKLHRAVARDLMTSNIRSLDQHATVRQAARLFCTARFSGAPVIDEAGRPVGVVSRTDVLRHLGGFTGENGRGAEGHPRANDRAETPVHRIMTRTVYSVGPDTPAEEVIEKLAELQVSRLFVVDRYGVLIGVVSAWDLLRRLAMPEPGEENGELCAAAATSHALAI